MARLLALEWDSREARVAVVRTGGKQIVVEQAFSVELTPRDPGQTFADTNVGQRVASALSANHVGRAETLVAVGRTGIELRSLTVPPAPPEEMPDLVRFQAMRQFSALGDDWPLDFVSLFENEEGGVGVLAAAIAPKLVAQIRETCGAGGLTPRRLVLRPFAAAALLRRRGGSHPCRLLVDLLADEVDLTVVVDQQVVFLRTVRLATGGAEQVARSLVPEMRRTMVAAQNQLGGRRVERVVICGSADEHPELVEQVKQNLELEVDLFNPFSDLKLGPDLEQRPPTHPGRFAPLLGMLADEAAGTAHLIDFLHPRKRPKPQNIKRRNLVMAAAAAVVVVGIALVIWLQLFLLDRQIKSLKQESSRLESNTKIAESTIEHADQIDNWATGDITWLDELYELSEEFPPADEARLNQMSITALPGGGGRMTLHVAATDSAWMTKVESDLRDDRHTVKGQGGSPADDEPKFTWLFIETVNVAAPDPDERFSEEPAGTDDGAVAPPRAEGEPAGRTGP